MAAPTTPTVPDDQSLFTQQNGEYVCVYPSTGEKDVIRIKTGDFAYPTKENTLKVFASFSGDTDRGSLIYNSFLYGVQDRMLEIDIPSGIKLVFVSNLEPTSVGFLSQQSQQS